MDNRELFHREEVPEINKRSLVKIIVKYCGNEGNMMEERKTSLRRLLQGTIDYLPRERDYVWRNAEINIYDNDENAFTVTSGNGENAFVVQYKGKTELIDVVNVRRPPYRCVLI